MGPRIVLGAHPPQGLSRARETVGRARGRGGQKKRRRASFETVERNAEKGKGAVAFRTRWEEKENLVGLLKMEVP